MKLRTKDLLTLSELDSDEFLSLINSAIQLKKETKPVLKNKTLVMIFEKPSTRTRISFEVGMHKLGGHAINIAAKDMQLARGETIEDTAKTISRYADCIMARVYKHELLESLAKHSSIPVINGLSNSFHPCQILADFMTIKEKKKKFKDLKIAWIGDGNNVCNSMINGAALAGVNMHIATPEKHEPDKTVVKQARKTIEIKITRDPYVAVNDADVVVTDTFDSVHNTQSRIKTFYPKYHVNSKLLQAAKKDAIFMHCLPAKRGQEVEDAVIDGPQSVVWDEAENRLYTQNALLIALIK